MRTGVDTRLPPAPSARAAVYTLASALITVAAFVGFGLWLWS